MNRRSFIALGAASLILPNAAFSAVGTPYTPGLVAQELDAGKTVFVDFYTDWCTTCARQGRVIQALYEETPAYRAAISFVKVDWDVHKQSDLAKSLQIPRRSTLVVLKGDQELGRIVAGTSKADIQGLLDTALAAATS